MKISTLVGGAAFSSLSWAQQAAYGQCGGSTWSGATTCISGYTCSAVNQYYAQCVPGGATATATTTLVTTKSTTAVTTAAKTSATSSVTTAAATGKFKWLGVDESGAEFGSGNIPGTWGKDFIFPSNSTLDVSSVSLDYLVRLLT